MLKCWLVADDSGSMSAYAADTERLFHDLKQDLELDFQVSTYKTSTEGMQAYSGTMLGCGGGDGLKHIGDLARNTAIAYVPDFIIYLTDGDGLSAAYTDITRHKILVVDVTAPSPIEKAEAILEALTHECSEYGPEECDFFACGQDLFTEQPFFPRWGWHRPKPNPTCGC